MKKVLIVLLACLALLIGSLYIFIPNIVKLRAVIAVNSTRPGLYRSLLDKKSVSKWWPGKLNKDSFVLNNCVYTLNNGNITIMPVTIGCDNTNIFTTMLFVPLVVDSTQLEWVGAMATSYNPVKRFNAYLNAKKINTDMNTVLQDIQTYYSNPENIYGFDIKKELVKDSTLIQTSDTSHGYPSIGFIYNLINKLKTYAASMSAKESGYPMLNIITSDSITFSVKVALPLDKPIPSSGEFLQKRMPAMGNILVTEVKGGNAIAGRAFDQIRKYADDYQRVAPAIPFYSLITDRSKEPDTSKWVTKVYYPVM